MKPLQVSANELRLADTILATSGGRMPWDTCIVSKVTDTEVKLFRPYGTTADFSSSGGVICYIGIEEFTIPRDTREVTLLNRKELR
jgi:hypothetical protein